MAKMKAAMAAVLVMEKEGVTQAFGVPGAAINPLYAALRERESISHILARHVEGASHMAEGYTRAKAGNIGVCIGTSGPAGTDMITGLYSAIADSIPILCITGQAPRARMYKEDFQAVDIESISKPVTKWSVTVREPALVPRVFQQAFHLMRSGRPGPVLIDLPFDVQMGEIEFDIDTYEPLPVYKPAATRKQVARALDMLMAAEKPLIVAGGGIITGTEADEQDDLRAEARLRDFNWVHGGVTTADRAQANGHRAGLVMFVGKPNSGKERFARALEKALFERGRHTYLLDGTNVLLGVDQDLTIDATQQELVRRFGEVAYLFLISGVILVSTTNAIGLADHSAVQALIGSQISVAIEVDPTGRSALPCDLRISGNESEAEVARVSELMEQRLVFHVPPKP